MNMTVFLEKVRVRTFFSYFDPIVTEPLELMYLQTVLSEEGITRHLIDPQFGKKAPQGVVPDLIVMTGYNVAEEKMRKQAARYKRLYPQAKIMASGVHAQINREAFRTQAFDYVCFSQRLEAFRQFLKDGKAGKGMDYRCESTGEWVLGEADPLGQLEGILPDRRFFYEIKDQTRYMDKRGVALVKGGHGCPYGCRFCYCRLLNQGRYIRPNFKEMADAVQAIDAAHIWLIDDSLLLTQADALAFIDAFKDAPVKKDLIAYLRADFVAKHRALLPALRASGLSEVIVGFESPDAKTLSAYNKGQSADVYHEAVGALKQADIGLTGLFIVDPAYGVSDFIRLFKYIKALGLTAFTLSVMTPLKGTEDYEEKKHLLTTHAPKKYDFLHLVVPSRLPKWLFYLLFYGGHLLLLKSKRIRRMIRGK